MEHILSCCPRALGDGRYRWHHDQVLRVIAEVISTGIACSRHKQPARENITFVKDWEKPHQHLNQSGGLLVTARSRGWRTRCNHIEVGCRGFVGQSLIRALKMLGVKRLHIRKAGKNITDADEKALRWLWIKRGDPWIVQATQTQARA